MAEALVFQVLHAAERQIFYVDSYVVESEFDPDALLKITQEVLNELRSAAQVLDVDFAEPWLERESPLTIFIPLLLPALANLASPFIKGVADGVGSEIGKQVVTRAGIDFIRHASPTQIADNLSMREAISKGCRRLPVARVTTDHDFFRFEYITEECPDIERIVVVVPPASVDPSVRPTVDVFGRNGEHYTR